MKISIFQKKKDWDFFFQNWEKSNLNSIGNGAECHTKKSLLLYIHNRPSWLTIIVCSFMESSIGPKWVKILLWKCKYWILKQANTLNPLLRHLYEVTYECVVDSALSMEELQQTKTGLYLAIFGSDTDFVETSASSTNVEHGRWPMFWHMINIQSLIGSNFRISQPLYLSRSSEKGVQMYKGGFELLILY